LKQPIDIETDSILQRRSLILSLAWPALAENILANLLSMVDMIMVGILGSYAIEAVGLVSQPRFLMLAAFQALSVGATAMVSRFKGSGDRENANVVLNQALVMAMGISVLVFLLMFFGGDPLLRFLAGSNIQEDTIRGAHIHLRIQVFGFPVLAFTFTINAVLRGVGNTRAAFYNNAVANIVNIFLNYCLIGGNLGFPALGIAGSATGTVIAQCIALGMALSKVLSGREFVRIQKRKLLRIDFTMIRRILNIGIPALVEQAIMRTGVMLYTIIVTSLGDLSYAAHMIAMNLQQFSFMTGNSFGIAATTLVGQSLGRKRVDQAKIYVKQTLNLNLIASVAVTLFLFFGGGLITRLYTDEPELSRLSANMLKIIAVANVFTCSRFVYTSALRGAGDSRFVAVITLIGVMLIRPILSFILVLPPLPFRLGLAGVWISLSSDGIICFFIARARFRAGKWADIKV